MSTKKLAAVGLALAGGVTVWQRHVVASRCGEPFEDGRRRCICPRGHKDPEEGDVVHESRDGFMWLRWPQADGRFVDVPLHTGMN